MVWKASLNRLATRLSLAARGVALPSTNCLLCDSDTEDIKHVLIKCPRSYWSLDFALVCSFLHPVVDSQFIGFVRSQVGLPLLIIFNLSKKSLRERMDLDLEARLMGETLILNKSFDPLYGDYIKLNDLNEPQELKRNRVDDLEPAIEKGEVVNKPMMQIVKTRCDFINGLDDYPSDCYFDGRICIDYAYNLKFSCMIGFEYVHDNFLPILPINVITKKFYNMIMKDKIKFRGRNELGNFVNALVFLGNFYVITNFIVVGDMDLYLDEGMGDVIVGEPFCKASYVEARRFDRIITIRDGDDSVTN
ncbi:homeodomain-like protein [Tanacetum coccineum]